MKSEIPDVKCEIMDAGCGTPDARREIHVLFCKSSLLKNQKSKIFLLVSCCLLLVSFCFSQTVSATLDRDKMLLGEQVILELKAENINTQSAPVINWFSLPDTGNHIEVIKRSPIDTIAVNGTISYIQNITLTAFDSGDWKLPSLQVVIQQNETDKKDTLRANELTIQVLPVDISNMQQYHAMKDIIDVDVQPNYLLIAGIILFILLAAAAIWFFIFKKKNKVPELKPVAARSLFETAIEQLEKLQKDNPPAVQFYARIDEICRTFIQNQLHIRALQLTSDELMVQMNVYIQAETRTSFYQLLRLISAVKFAKYAPEETQKTMNIDTAKAVIEHIYYQMQRSLLQHAT